MKFIKKIIKKNELYDLFAVRKINKRNLKNKKTITNIEDYEIKHYFNYYGVYPNLENPKKFSEFLLWQKLYFYDERATTMTDKILCKEYFKNIIGDELHFMKILGIYNSASEIDLKKLPDEFVLKCNHNSGYIFHIAKTKNDKYQIKNLRDKTYKKYSFNTMKKILDELLKINYYYNSFEWNYKDIEPKIFAEQYLDSSELREYKFFVNNGELLMFYTVSNRHIEERDDYFDANLQNMDVWADVPPSDVPPALPKNINQLIKIAKKISKGFPILRVDLYNYQGQIFFGEATFFHMGGYLEFKYPKNLDELLGENVIVPSAFLNSKLN